MKIYESVIKRALKRTVILSVLFAVVLAGQPMKISYAADVSPTILINGQLLKSEKKALIIDGSTYVPLRAVAENFQAEVIWKEGAARDVVILKDGNVIQLSSKYSYSKANINGEERYIETNPKLIDGTTMIPLRMIGELLNLKVSWDSNTSTVRLDKKETKLANLTNLKGYVLSPYLYQIEILASDLRIIDVPVTYPSSEYSERIAEINADIDANIDNQDKVMELSQKRSELNEKYAGYLRGYKGKEVTFNLKWNEKLQQLTAEDVIFSELSSNADYEQVKVTAVPERILYSVGTADVFQLKSETDGTSFPVLNTLSTQTKVTNLAADPDPRVQDLMERTPFRGVSPESMNNELFSYKIEVEGLRNKSTGLIVADHMHYTEQTKPYTNHYDGNLVIIEKRIVDKPDLQVYSGHYASNMGAPSVDIEFRKGSTRNFTLNNLSGAMLLVTAIENKISSWSFFYNGFLLGNGEVSKIAAQTDEDVTFEIVSNETTVKFVTVALTKLNNHPADYYVGKSVAAAGTPKGLDALEAIWFSLFE